MFDAKIGQVFPFVNFFRAFRLELLRHVPRFATKRLRHSIFCRNEVLKVAKIVAMGSDYFCLMVILFFIVDTKIGQDSPFVNFFLAFRLQLLRHLPYPATGYQGHASICRKVTQTVCIHGKRLSVSSRHKSPPMSHECSINGPFIPQFGRSNSKVTCILYYTLYIMHYELCIVYYALKKPPDWNKCPAGRSAFLSESCIVKKYVLAYSCADCCLVVHADEHAPLVELQLQFVRQLDVVAIALFINLGDDRLGEVCFHVVGDGSRDE